MAASRKVEAIHPLTAAQEGILFHSLYAPSSGVYAAQLSCRFIGDLDVEAFRAAWRWLMHRHPVLRASFLWEELEQPVQVVSREVEVPLTVEDLRQLPAEKQAEAVEAFLARERERDFEPERAPLFRLTLLRLADDVYRFVWSRHHLILDGWSLAIVLEELFAIYTHGVYDHGVAGREPELPAPRPYRDYLRWLKQQDQEAAEHFWRRTLKGIEGPTPLWGERDPAGRDAEHRGEENKKLSTTATARIEEWARRLQVTPSTVVQGAWAALLSRLSGEEDVVFGVVVSGRPPALPGVDSMVGMFINTLPCRVRVAPRQVVSQWLDSLRQSQMAIEAHGHAPLVRVQGWSDVPAGTALFDSIVAFENYPLDRLALRDLAGLKVRQVEAGEATSYALALQITPGERLALGIEYDAGRFSPISIRRTLAHVEALLDSMGRRPQQRLGDLSLLSPSAQHQLKVEWNTPPAPQHPVATLAIDRITQQMQERPDAVAVVAEGEVASYDELGRRSRCLAEALMASGLEPETPIGVLAERSVEMVVGLLGVLRAGAAFLPLDPTDPEERLRFVLDDAGVRLLLTQQPLATLSRAIAPPDRCRTVWLDAGGPGLTPSPALTRPQPVADLRPEQAAYVIYTSGSTGRPKGVVISHSAMSNILHHRATGCDARDAKLQKTALSFDVAVAEIFLPLMVGGRTVLARPGGHYDGEYLTDLLRRERVTLAAFPPSTLGPILDAWQLSDCPALRTVGVGGDVVPSDLPARFHAQSDAALHNRYGPTEATIFMTEWRCQRQTHHPSAKASPLPIGRPAGGAQVHLVDDRLTPMPVAVAGELTVGGACLARGYLDRPALTAQRFVPDPFTYGGRLYRTGDLARYRDDGAIEFLGRSDQQIKIRGFRVELGEVESVLAAHPTVQETAVVFRRDDATANGQLIAYVVAPSRNGDLRHFLQQQLPDYMVPKALVHLDRLPLTSSGKVDRQALERRALPAPATAPTSARSLPQTDREKVLAEIWRAVLRHETIGIDDNFFELGGDSILSLQVVTRARQAGLEISPRLLFEHPTIGQLAEVARHPSGTREAPPESGELPLSPIQQWFFEQDFAEPWHWNQSVLLRPRSSLEMPRIVRVLTQLTARHAALRCRFQHQQGVWLQEISPVPGPPPALEIDLTSLLATDQPAVMARITAELQASLDLASGPLQRLALFRLAVAIGDRLLWLVHHLAVDAVSWRILLEEFELIYHLEAANDTPPLPPATSSLASWHQQARGLAESTDLATGRLGQWTDRPWSLVPSLPVDGTRTGINAEHTSQKVTTWLPAAHVKRLLRRAPKAYRASVEELLVAALAQAYHGWTGSRWLSLDLEGHGREEIAEGLDLSRTVGWFTALYPVLLELPEKGDAESAVRVGLIKEQLRGYAGRDFSLLRFLGPDSARQRLAELPSPEMLFNYLGQIDAAQTASSLFELAPESSGPDHSPRAQRRHLLEWTAAILDRQLRIELRYGADVHHRSTVEALAEDFLNALRDLIDPTASEQLPRFTPADFPAAAIDQPALDRLVAQFEGEGEGQPHPRIEALYPLSPMQEGLPRPALEALFPLSPMQEGLPRPALEALFPLSPMQEGMLFHSLLAPQSGIFTGRLSCRLQGELDREAFRRAWERLVERHGVFRTAFAWEGLERPLQGVLESVELPLASLDWRSLPSAEQEVRWEQLRTADSALDLARPPLMRLTLARIADGAWRFAWTFHHLLLDGWSLAAVLQELFTLYEAEASNTPPRLPPARPFSHYVDWLAVQDLAPTKAYWRRLLRGFESPTPLGVDRSPPDGSELGAGTEEATRLLSTEVSAGLKALGQQHRVTSSILVQTAWSVLLSRYGETSDVVFGIVVSGRPPALKGVQSMVGLLINTLPVRVSVAPTGSLPVLLRELQQQQLASLELQHTPLVRIQNWSEIPANGPLFHSIVAFENYPIDAAVAALEGPLQVHDLSTVESSNYPLNLMVLPVRGQADTPERLRFRLLYDPERFDVATVHRLLGHAETVLAAMASDVDLPLGDLPLLTAAERTQVLREWNDTARPWSNDRLLHQLFEDQVARQPNATAVIDAYGETLDYGELNRRANRLAHALRRLGIGPGRPVAIHLEPSVHMVAAVLAVLKAGGAYVPLALSFPAGRIEWILGALNISCLITESARLPALDKLWERLPNLENILCPSPWPGKDEALATEVSAPVSLLRRRDLAAYPEDDPAPAGRASDAAYVIFTSGSTGTPKGVMERHEPVLNLIEWITREHRMGPDDRVLAVASLSFDLSVYDIFGLLAVGGSIRVAGSDELRDPEGLVRILVEEGITYWDSAPAALQQLVPFFPGPGEGGEALRLVYLSGDWVPLALPDQVRSVFPRAQVIALGGATEATVWSNYFSVGEVAEDWVSIPYGRPIQNARYHVLGRSLEPCPVRLAGDLYIGGDCLAAGYAQEPVLTAEKFVPDPWSEAEGGRLYRTGDRARFWEDGLIEFLGRLDHQVKIRGFRIELGEIESVLTEDPGVDDAVVLVRDDLPAGRGLVAYVNAPGGDLSNEVLRQQLGERLPEYMVPSFLLVLPSLPLTSNGKVDRKALLGIPLPVPGRETTGDPTSQPLTPTEARLAKIWREVLRLEGPVGSADNFFELGGDSILTIQLVSRAREAGLELSPRLIFTHPTLGELAGALGTVAEQDQRQIIGTEPAVGAVALTPIQHWFFDQLDPEDEPWHWNQTLLLTVRRRLVRPVVEQALAVLLEQHDMLRARFESRDGAWHQHSAWHQHIAATESRAPLHEIDLGSLPESRRRAALEAAGEQVQASLDLAAGPLLRLAIFRGLDDEAPDRLLWVIHHLAVDAVSWRILLGDFEAAVRRIEAGETPGPAPRTTSYQAWSAALGQRVDGADTSEAARNWLSVPWPEAVAPPFDQPADDDREAGARTLTADLGAEATEALLQRANRARDASMEDLLLAALLRAWGEWTGHRGLHLDLEGHGRDAINEGIDLSHTVGWFTALDPVLLFTSEDGSPEQTLRAVHQQLDVLRRRPSFGPSRYLAGAKARESLAPLPVAPVLFNYLGRLDSALPADSLLALASESPGAAHSPHARRRHPIELSASVLDGTLRLEIRYPGQRLQRASIETLVDAWRQSLLTYAETPAAIVVLTDFPDVGTVGAKLGQVLGELEGQGNRAEALLPLSPSQEGMLFHSLLDPQAGAYLGQVHLLLRGDLDSAAFTRAWQGLLQRHAVLRTAFAWRELDQPLQGVLGEVELPLDTLDWRQMPAAAQTEHWQELLAEDRRKGFDFAQAPLMRLALIRLDESTHRLLWTYHHTILDGWSLAMLFEELFAFYQTAVQGAEPRLPDRRPWADYLHWLAWHDLGPAEAYWQRRLAGFHQPTPLGIERAKPSKDASEADGPTSRRTERRQLPRDLSQQLDALAKRSDSTLNTLVHAAWALLLGRLGGTRDVVFGSVVSGRPPSLRGVESMVGLFITTLPCRVGLGNQRLAPWLAELRDDLLELRDYEHTPPVAIQSWSEVDSGSDLFDSLVVFENYPISGVASTAAGLEVLDTGAIERSHYPLSLQVVPEDAGILLLLHHDADRFEPTAAQRLIGHAEQLLAGLVGDGERRLDDLAMLSPAQTAQLTREWNDSSVVSNDSPVVSPKAQSVHRLISQQAQATPDAVAVVFESQTLSYRELDRRASHFGHRLRTLGIGRDETVGLAMERSLELPTAVLGILHTGAGYLPLDPDDPAERREYILADAGVAVLVASGAETTDASTAYRRIDFAAELNTQTEEAASPVDRVDDDGTAYLIYTSGSTGRPKGTVNVHRAVRNQVEWLQRRYPIGPTDRVLQKTPISFDVSVWELFWPLSVGACLVMARPGGHRDPAYLARTIGSHRITTTHFVPSMLQLFLEEPNIEVHAPTLRQVVVSGEALPLGLERRFFERLAVPLPNMYGPSEAARSSFYDCSLADTLPVAPIGRPTSNTALHIADRLLRQAPLGASGELLIGGAQLARGYHRRPGLTAQKFIPDPFGDQPGTRLYCSGDRVGFATDGRIEFLGRIDHQVKVRGVRVEPGEIEAILQQHSDIREAVVVTLGTGAQLRLCAVVVPATERTQSLDGLRDYLEGRLPLAAVPSHFEVLEELPLLPSGKADRVALTRRAESAGAGLSEDLRQAPRTPTEELLAGIWSNVLGLEPGTFGTDEDFFALGGHSLLATRVASRLRAAFDVELPLRTLFEASTVAELAREVEVTRAGALAVPPIEPRREPMPEAGWPASFAQERLWFLDQLDPGTPVFNLPSAIRLRGQLDIAALRAAFADLGQRHETLRTAFADAGGRPAQVIDEAFTGSIAEIDLASIEPSERHGTVRQLMRREAMRRFDLCHAPLVRATLLRLRADPADDHLLLLTLHHVISDGWSSAVLVREIGALYAAHAIGQPTPRPKLPVQYADFALWQRDWLTPSRMRTEIDYWRHRLEGAPPALELPTDRPRPAVFDHHGHSVQRRLDHPMAAKLRGLAQRRGATLFMVLSAAFAALLRRLSGQDDVALGAPIAGRTRAEIEGLVGFFVNSLVLRPDLPGDPTFADLLERTRHTALEAYEHQDLPFEKLVEALQPQRDPSRPPLFQAALVLQNAAPEPLELPGLELEPLIAERRQVQLELELEAVEGTFFEPDEAGLSLRLAYATRLFDETRMRRTLDQLVHLLQAAVHQPERRISEMALLSRVESQQILIEWSTPSEQGRNGGLPLELFDAWLQRTPEALAVVSDGPSGSASALTYAELDRRARRLARNFRRRGIGREAVVAVAMERAPELVVALLAILRSGGAFLPLNPKDPSQRLRTVLRDARASLLLTQTRLATELVDLPCEHLCLDGKRPADFERDGMSPLLPPTVIREQAAYVIYTSGSTGKPKGVVISHGALGRLLRYRAATVTTADAKLHKTALSFDVAVAEIFLPLVSGGRTVLARPGGAQDGPYLARLIRRQRVSLAVFPPALLGSLLEQGSLADCLSLRLVGVGGEAVPGELPGRFAAASRAALWNRYGPTEATIFATEGRADTDEAGHCLPIGRPAAGARAVLLDRRLRPVPAGVTGEICLAGPTLARGYLGRPAATAAAFVPDAFQAGRLYRTGDLGRQQADGTLEFLGRRDAQVKIRGFRVELGEVEAILARLASVREVVVTVDEGPIPSSRRLLAYVVPATASASPAELRRAARERLPDYMVPAQVVLLDALPRTAHGKVNRSTLPSPTPERSLSDDGFVAPQSGVEEVLSGIWGEVLGLERVSVHDDFFDLGGHSLLATQVVSRIDRSLAIELPVRAVFEQPTIARLARRVDAEQRSKEGLTAPPIVPVDRHGELPLSFAQERMCFLHQLAPHSSQYNVASCIRLNGELEISVLRACFTELIRRHEALRTTFPVVDGQPIQRIAPPWADNLELTLADLSALAAIECESAIHDLARRAAARPFDLQHGPLLRIELLRLAPDDHVLLLGMHHIVSDGWSVGVLIREMATLYAAYRAGEPSPLPVLGVQYADFAAWQRRWLTGWTLERQLSYWRQHLDGAPETLALPTDRPRKAVRSARGDSRPLRLTPELSQAVAALARQRGVSLFMTLLAAFEALLHRICASDDLVIGSPIANRNRRETEDLIGFFVNALVLRADLTGDPSFAEHLSQVRETTLDAYMHQDLPFEKLVEELRPARDLGHTPLFQVVFGLQNLPLDLTLPELRLEPFPVPGSEAKFDLTWTLSEIEPGTSGGHLAGWIEYSSDLFDTTTIARLERQFETVLTNAVAEPERHLSELELLQPAQRAQVLREWNAAPPVPDTPQRLETLFIDQARQRPEAIAVVWDDEHLSYATLARRSRALALHLRQLGVDNEVRVGLCLRRSPDLVVAILGVLQAGGAYVPIDPSYPADRIAFLAEDAGFTVLVRDEQTTTAIPQPRDRELRVITVDSSRDLSAARHDPSTPQPARGSVDALAYVIYTSGSTGKPKGSLIAHRNVAQLLAATRRLFRCSPEDIWTLFHSYAFDFSVWELWGALAHGGRLVVVPRLVSRSPDDFRQLLTRQRVSILNQTPSAFLQLAPSLIEASRRGAESSPQQVSMRQVCLKQVPLRQVIFGGEALEPARLRPWLDHFGDGRHDSGPRLINMYGITETTVHVTYRVLERDDAIPSDAAASPAGRALDHLALHLLDRRGHPVPIGVPGEIYVGGEGLGRGYLDRPSLTAERFVPADGHRGGERLYRSGDLARWLARGEIDFLGRIDQQIKIRGFRIELGEIEANLAAHPEIRDVAVLPRHASATAEDQRLVAYLVARENEGDTVLLPQSGEPTSDAKAQPTAGELRSFLAQSLPEYMIPAAFVPLEALPLTPHGKLDRAALPNPDGERPDLGQAYVPPRRAIETVLCEVWAEMLEVERVGIEDNFFDLGGHSLLVTQVTSWVRETFEVEVSLQTFFAAPTVAALAMAMQEDPASQQRVQRTAELLLELSDDEADEAV